MIVLARQFARFTGVGFTSAAGHYALLIALVQGADVSAVTASAAGALLGAWINYSLNYHFTFRSVKQHREAVLKFTVVAAMGLALNTLLMWIGVELIGAYYLLSQVVATGLVAIWSFTGNRCWSFYAGESAE